MDIIIGGIPQYFYDSKRIKSSIAYYQDDYTWCVQRARLLPLFLNIPNAAPGVAWASLFIVCFANGLILFIFMQFDRKDAQCHTRDVFYATLLISMPAIIGISQRFHPKYWPLRIYYCSMLFEGIFIFAVGLSFALECLKKSIWAHQVYTIAEIIENNYRLAGTRTIAEIIQQQVLVSST